LFVVESIGVTVAGEKKKFLGKKGEVRFSKGLEGIVACESTKSCVDGDKGVLIYHGLKIEEVCKKSNFEEVCYLFIYDRWPRKNEFNMWKRHLAQYREIPAQVYEFIKETAKYNVHPMALLRTAVSLLGLYDEEADDDSLEAQERKAARIISRMSTVVAALGRIRNGKEPVLPSKELGHAANFFYIYHGREPDRFEEEVFDDLLILHADHECSASTFTTIVIGSSLSDIYSSVTGAIGSLKGPLHGGANERVMMMLDEIGEASRVESYITDAIAKKRKIMGFGHRVYKTYDPRVAVLKKHALEASKRAGMKKWLNIAEMIQKVMVKKLGHKGVFGNVDLYSGIVMASLGIDTAMFTPIFAVGRICGWAAHYLEQLSDIRIFRPRFVYTGPLKEHYVPINKR